MEMFDLTAATSLWHTRRFPRHDATAIRIAKLSPSGRLLITPSKEDIKHLAIWNAETGERLGELRGHTSLVTGAAFIDDGRLCSWGSDGTIRVWDVGRRKALCVSSLVAPQASLHKPLNTRNTRRISQSVRIAPRPALDRL